VTGPAVKKPPLVLVAVEEIAVTGITSLAGASVKSVDKTMRVPGVDVAVLKVAVTIAPFSAAFMTPGGVTFGKVTVVLAKLNDAEELTVAPRVTVAWEVTASAKPAPIKVRVSARIAKRAILRFISFPPWK